jgi:hypothetical protein
LFCIIVWFAEAEPNMLRYYSFNSSYFYQIQGLQLDSWIYQCCGLILSSKLKNNWRSTELWVAIRNHRILSEQ